MYGIAVGKWHHSHYAICIMHYSTNTVSNISLFILSLFSHPLKHIHIFFSDPFIDLFSFIIVRHCVPIHLSTMHNSTLLPSTLPYPTLLCSTPLYSTLLYFTLLYFTLLFYCILHSLHSSPFLPSILFCYARKK